MIDKIIFSERFKLLRNQNNNTMVDVANALEISKQSVHQWDTGKTVPTADKLFDLANYFNVSIDYLLGRGIFAKEDSILLHKEKVIESLCLFYDTDFFKKTEAFPSNQFMVLLSCVIQDIDFKEENGEININIYPLLPPESGDIFEKITL